MLALRRRLEKLERTIGAEVFCVASQFIAVNQAALGKLSSADRDVLQNGRGQAAKEGKSYEDAWGRWETALATAVHEAKCPFDIYATDWWWL